MTAGARRVALNGPMELTFDGELDPLSVTPRAVRVRDEGGGPLPHRLRVDGRDLLVELRVDQRRYAEPPARVEVSMAGGLSRHAVCLLDGRRLTETTAVSFDVAPELEAGDGGALAVGTVNGLPVAPGVAVPVTEPLVLGLSGVVDPGSVTPGACPLFPQAAGLSLEPVLPSVEWEVVGHRSRLTLHAEDAAGPMLLTTRRWSLRSLDGSPIEPPIVVELTGD